MVLYRNLKPFRFDHAMLDHLVYFFWMIEYILTNFDSKNYFIKLMESESSGFGEHWGGFFISLKDLDGIVEVIIHTGLVYYPGTESGIYFEAERLKNQKIYEKLVKDAQPSDMYDLNRTGKDYLKFFFPKSKLNKLMDAKDVDTQIEMLRAYYNACFTGMLETALK